MNIVLAGDWHSNVHERPMADAMDRLGHVVDRFAWHSYVSDRVGHAGASSPGELFRKAQNKFLIGPLMARINRDLIDRVAAARCDLLFVYRGTHITRATLEEIRVRSPRTRLVGYNNDDPFAPGQSKWPWRHFLSAIPAYDRVLAYRPHNLDDFRAAGGRLAALESLAEAGVNLRLFGPGVGYPGHEWHRPLSQSARLHGLMPVREIWDAEYARALSASKIALCFFSKRNRDRYTRRCFEIPATGTMLLSEYSPELAAIYREGVEADFFRTPAELVDKVRFYLAHPDAREGVARQGYERVHRDGHDVDSRVRRMLDALDGAAQFERAG